jgi:hypothetical protein
MGIVFATNEPLQTCFSGNAGTDFFDYQIAPSIWPAIRALDNAEASVRKKLACKQFELIALGTFDRTRYFCKIQNWHGNYSLK